MSAPDTRPEAGSGAMALVVAYDGAPFAGFARQPGLDTVQGRLETALGIAMRREVVTTGAGRTDAGVHAAGQVISFDTLPGEEIEPARLRRSVDVLAGDGIVIRDARLARAGFSARFDATAREYRYRIVTGVVPPLFLERFVWHVGRNLDVAAMKRAAAWLIGEHDFRSFCVARSAEGKRTMRRVDSITILPEEHLGERCLTVTVRGNAFLHSMVRTIVGSLVEVGAGRRKDTWVGEALEAADRTAAGPAAPAQGLTFWTVEYPDEVWIRPDAWVR